MRYPDYMTPKLHTRTYLPAAVLAVLSFPANPACADRRTIGDFPPYVGPGSVLKNFSSPTPPDSAENNVKPIDKGDFGPAPLLESPDLDKSAQMQMRWDEWHKQLANTVYERFNAAATQLFKHSPAISCQISYMVASDGRIGNVRILQPSANPIFNTVLVNIIRSMQGNPVLAFPSGSHRKFVEKTGTFTWNHSLGVDCQPERPAHIGPPEVSK